MKLSWKTSLATRFDPMSFRLVLSSPANSPTLPIYYLILTQSSIGPFQVASTLVDLKAVANQLPRDAQRFSKACTPWKVRLLLLGLQPNATGTT